MGVQSVSGCKKKTFGCLSVCLGQNPQTRFISKSSANKFHCLFTPSQAKQNLHTMPISQCYGAQLFSQSVAPIFIGILLMEEVDHPANTVPSRFEKLWAAASWIVGEGGSTEPEYLLHFFFLVWFVLIECPRTVTAVSILLSSTFGAHCRYNDVAIALIRWFWNMQLAFRLA